MERTRVPPGSCHAVCKPVCMAIHPGGGCITMEMVPIMITCLAETLGLTTIFHRLMSILDYTVKQKGVHIHLTGETRIYRGATSKVFLVATWRSVAQEHYRPQNLALSTFSILAITPGGGRYTVATWRYRPRKFERFLPVCPPQFMPHQQVLRIITGTHRATHLQNLHPALFPAHSLCKMVITTVTHGVPPVGWTSLAMEGCWVILLIFHSLAATAVYIHMIVCRATHPIRQQTSIPVFLQCPLFTVLAQIITTLLHAHRRPMELTVFWQTEEVGQQAARRRVMHWERHLHLFILQITPTTVSLQTLQLLSDHLHRSQQAQRCGRETEDSLLHLQTMKVLYTLCKVELKID